MTYESGRAVVRLFSELRTRRIVDPAGAYENAKGTIDRLLSLQPEMRRSMVRWLEANRRSVQDDIDYITGSLSYPPAAKNADLGDRYAKLSVFDKLLEEYRAGEPARKP
jgi:hypothetical protein